MCDLLEYDGNSNGFVPVNSALEENVDTLILLEWSVQSLFFKQCAFQALPDYKTSTNRSTK